MDDQSAIFWGDASEARASLSAGGLLDPSLYAKDMTEAVTLSQWSNYNEYFLFETCSFWLAGAIPILFPGYSVADCHTMNVSLYSDLRRAMEVPGGVISGGTSFLWSSWFKRDCRLLPPLSEQVWKVGELDSLSPQWFLSAGTFLPHLPLHTCPNTCIHCGPGAEWEPHSRLRRLRPRVCCSL